MAWRSNVDGIDTWGGIDILFHPASGRLTFTALCRHCDFSFVVVAAPCKISVTERKTHLSGARLDGFGRTTARDPSPSGKVMHSSAGFAGLFVAISWLHECLGAALQVHS